MDCSAFDLGCYIDWVIEEIKLLFISFADQIMSSIAGVFESIPVPGFLQNIGAFSLSSDILYFTTLFQLPAGLSLVVSAYTARFILRRIPVIG
ncbi:Uncharacterised protein [BD1-7 clade bacterium]|uniref:DUF2523 domain-containing protein n=1 Tax=BD1-7 clade bacterium TaxID=2029982 RepID=A0A5S9PCK8_9GAMM|nr:Uncharacterised protein [BD1-7 clade bacterium]CAA0101618.1 Uncharacterised protein [BD1-7 clade bacterium]